MIFYRIIIYFITIFIIIKMTGLGDYTLYINSNPISILKKYKVEVLTNSTYFTRFFISLVKKILLNSNILTGIFFNLVSTYGILKFIKSTNFNKKIYFLTLFPSFSIWSSYPSKESFVVFGTSILMSYLIKYRENKKNSKQEKYLILISVYLLFIFKKQYLISMLTVYLFFKYKKKIELKFKIIILIYSFFSIILLMYLFRNEIDIFFRDFSKYFTFSLKRGMINSNRNIDIFKERYGFFKNMFYGMFIGIWGPSIKDVKNFMTLFCFFESVIISIVLLVVFFIKILKKNLDMVLIFFISIFLLLIVQYPFGIFNSGSAIRYRTNLYIIILGYFYIFSKRRKKR